MNIRVRAMVLLPALWVAPAVSAQEGVQPRRIGDSLDPCVHRGGGPGHRSPGCRGGQSSRTCTSLRPSLATSARELTVDRPGLGQSLSGVLRRTPTQIAQELRTVVQAMDLSGPLVLVRTLHGWSSHASLRDLGPGGGHRSRTPPSSCGRARLSQWWLTLRTSGGSIGRATRVHDRFAGCRGRLCGQGAVSRAVSSSSRLRSAAARSMLAWGRTEDDRVMHVRPLIVTMFTRMPVQSL